MEIKLFGGAQVLAFSDYPKAQKTIGEQNVLRAMKILEELGLSIISADIGGTQGRKLFFDQNRNGIFA